MEVKAPLAPLPAAAASQPVLAAYAQINHLKDLFRQGWLRKGVPRVRCESVAEHTAGVAWLAVLLTPEFPELNTLCVLRMALLHDLGEVHAGDIVPGQGVAPEVKHALEREGLERVLAGVPGAEALMALWDEYEVGETPEARFVRALDRLEMGLQAARYAEAGVLAEPSDFLRSARDAVSQPALRALLEAAFA